MMPTVPNSKHSAAAEQVAEADEEAVLLDPAQ